MPPSRVVARLEELREEIQYSRKRLAGQLKPKRTRQAIDAALSQRTRLTVQDAEAIAEMLGVRLEVVSPGNAANALRRALDSDGELDDRWREIVWSAYQHARSQSARSPARRERPRAAS